MLFGAKSAKGERFYLTHGRASCFALAGKNQCSITFYSRKVKKQEVYMLQENEVDVGSMTDEELEKAMSADGQTQPDQELEKPSGEPTAPAEEKSVAEKEETPSEEPKGDEEIEKPNEDGKVDNKALKGLTRDLAGERERRRQAEAETERLRNELAGKVEKETTAKKVNEKKEALDSISDDEIIDGKTVKSVLSTVHKLEETVEQQSRLLAERDRRDEENRIEKTDAIAKETYSASKVGEQLAYDKVIAEGFIPLIQKDPALAQRVRQSANPAEESYRLGVNALYSPLDLINMQRPAEKPEPNSQKPKPAPQTLGSAPAGGGGSGDLDPATLTDEQLRNLSDKDLEKLMRKT